MKLQKYEYRTVTELTEVELTKELAQACEQGIKEHAVYPEQVPHISMQTLAQCWANNVCDDALEDYKLLTKWYSVVQESRLIDEIRGWLQDMMWTASETQAVVVDSESTDSEDDYECTPDEYLTLIRNSNPDFSTDKH